MSGNDGSPVQWDWSAEYRVNSRGTIERVEEDSGVVTAEHSGDALLEVLRVGTFWGMNDDDGPLTVTIERVAQ